ncbi:sensor histidine kinase [Calidifontibacter sp. DB0510]|uniref:histidine kinase n=1 Tax=Metallococcus carri TaxID=1656884 RepID=A0A967EDV8_9MICO|nr:histidine kinase [Metallococcus carri]NHN55081.1 sensor histidine kinase [Metallococcus carri]NOP36158.1 sensor histidine kinase [Calidifontibacter sp. DB2511S]
MSDVLLPSPPRWRRAWGEVWRVLAAAFFGLSIYAIMGGQPPRGYEDGHPWIFVDLLIGLVCLGLMLLRRRFPLLITLITLALTAFAVTATGAAMVCLISLATHRRARQIILAAVVSVAAGLLFDRVHPTPGDDTAQFIANVVIGVLATGLAIALGVAIGSRRELLASLRERVRIAESEQHARAVQARIGERARIAREMHDVLAHRISLVAMHSGALAYRTDLPPAEVRATSELIRDNAQLALAELREVLGVLRDTELHGIEPPQPSIADLSALVADTPASDGPASLAMDEDLTGLSDSLSRNAFRVVQEALTNRRKHAPGQPIEIVVERDDHAVTIRCTNPMLPGHRSEVPGAGLGLIGLSERLALAGGTLEHETDRGGRFSLRAVLPTEPKEPAG